VAAAASFTVLGCNTPPASEAADASHEATAQAPVAEASTTTPSDSGSTSESGAAVAAADVVEAGVDASDASAGGVADAGDAGPKVVKRPPSLQKQLGVSGILGGDLGSGSVRYGLPPYLDVV
jgi:hypothetical protein